MLRATSLRWWRQGITTCLIGYCNSWQRVKSRPDVANMAALKLCRNCELSEQVQMSLSRYRCAHGSEQSSSWCLLLPKVAPSLSMECCSTKSTEHIWPDSPLQLYTTSSTAMQVFVSISINDLQRTSQVRCGCYVIDCYEISVGTAKPIGSTYGKNERRRIVRLLL